MAKARFFIDSFYPGLRTRGKSRNLEGRAILKTWGNSRNLEGRATLKTWGKSRNLEGRATLKTRGKKVEYTFDLYICSSKVLPLLSIAG